MQPTNIRKYIRHVLNEYVTDKYANTISKLPLGQERVLADTDTQINIPVAIGWDGKSPDKDMVAKTVMRKKNFLTKPESPKLALEDESVDEDISVPINVGDTVLGGRFKNKKIVVKDIDKNEKGDITINNKPLLKVRLTKENFEDRIKWDTVILEPAQGDKHDNIQLNTKDKDKYTHMKSLFVQLKEMYPELKFFLQGDNSSGPYYWLMFEPWSSDVDKIIEAATWLSQQLKLPIDIDN